MRWKEKEETSGRGEGDEGMEDQNQKGPQAPCGQVGAVIVRTNYDKTVNRLTRLTRRELTFNHQKVDRMGKANQKLQLARLKQKRLEYLRRKWKRLSQMLLLADTRTTHQTGEEQPMKNEATRKRAIEETWATEKTRKNYAMKQLVKLEEKRKTRFMERLVIKVMCLNDEQAGLMDKLTDMFLKAQGIDQQA